MHAFVTAGAGFLLAVLWFDLMHDVLVRGHEGRDVPEPALDTIRRYYARVTTAASPMNRLVALAMLVTVVSIGVQIGSGSVALGLVSLVLAVPPMALAFQRTMPSAVRLGAGGDDPAEQSRLARRIHADHWFCFGSILALIVVQLVASAV